ncbi:Hypothetical protein, putative [Bodo saltans]|uniref:Phosphatidylinositol-4-phosphate 5-kinase n=1 Tax=Bodo saltans TaxID=75058 RepID=A0A0S4JTD1_BODSA|nr:Hypothetical protein, putative [Bodo saltans]|eukprot:CUG93522.1 Hypothetical protein, putative [Bodo saltans]
MSSPSSFYLLADEPRRRVVEVNERYNCGDRYKGSVYVNAEGVKIKHGTGRYEFQNGSYYSGEWVDGAMHGKGLFWESTTGDRFDGQWHRGKRVCGVYYFHDGDLYIGGFDEATGHLKHGRAVVVEDMTPYDAEYKDDAMVKRTPFNTSVAAPFIPHQRDRPASSSGQKHRGDEATRAERIEQQQDRQLQAAKSILRSRREGLSADAAVFSANDVQLNESKQRLFGKLQRGQSERFMHPHLPDANDAVRFHHR